MNLTAVADPFVPAPYRVAHVRREMRDVATLELCRAAGERPAFQPGQFNMLYAFGVGEVAISMSGDPARMGSYVHTVRNVGAVSGAIAALKEGAILGLRGPFGTAWPSHGRRRQRCGDRGRWPRSGAPATGHLPRACSARAVRPHRHPLWHA